MFRTAALASNKFLHPTLWPPVAVSDEARQLVRIIFSKRKAEFGLSTYEIYKDGRAFLPDRPMTEGRHERSEQMHPFRSMRHLKMYVLEDLARDQKIEKVHVAIKARIPTPPPDDNDPCTLPSEPTRLDVMNLVAKVTGEERTIKVVLPPRGQVSDKFWVWRTLPALFDRPKPRAQNK